MKESRQCFQDKAARYELEVEELGRRMGQLSMEYNEKVQQKEKKHYETVEKQAKDIKQLSENKQYIEHELSIKSEQLNKTQLQLQTVQSHNDQL